MTHDCGGIGVYWKFLLQENLLTGDYHSCCQGEVIQNYYPPWYEWTPLQEKRPIPISKQAMQGSVWLHACYWLQGGGYSLRGEVRAGQAECERSSKDWPGLNTGHRSLGRKSVKELGKNEHRVFEFHSRCLPEKGMNILWAPFSAIHCTQRFR